MEYEYGWCVESRQSFRKPVSGSKALRAAREFALAEFPKDCTDADLVVCTWPDGTSWTVPHVTVGDMKQWVQRKPPRKPRMSPKKKAKAKAKASGSKPSDGAPQAKRPRVSKQTAAAKERASFVSRALIYIHSRLNGNFLDQPIQNQCNRSNSCWSRFLTFTCHVYGYSYMV